MSDVDDICLVHQGDDIAAGDAVRGFTLRSLVLLLALATAPIDAVVVMTVAARTAPSSYRFPIIAYPISRSINTSLTYFSIF